MRLHEAVDAIEGIGGNAAAVAQPRRELAVVDGASAERGLGQAGAAAIVGDFLEQLLRVHGTRPWRFPNVRRARVLACWRVERGWPSLKRTKRWAAGQPQSRPH